MPTDQLMGLFGSSAYDVEQARNKQALDYAVQMANMNNIQQAKMGIGQGAAGIARAGAGMFGLVDPKVEEAKRTQAIMAQGWDLTTSKGLKEKAAQFYQAGDQTTALKLLMLARKQEQEESKMALEAATTEAQRYKATLEAAQAAKALKENPNLSVTEVGVEGKPGWLRKVIYDKSNPNAPMQQIGEPYMSSALGKQTFHVSTGKDQEKPLTAAQRANLGMKINVSSKELRSVQGAAADLEAKANELIKHPGLPAATGIMGGLPSIPGSDAANATALLKEFKDAIKNQGLKLVREGGSIGSMTQQEWPMVESMIANIDPVKLGLQGTKDQILKAVNYAKTIVKRAEMAHSDMLSVMPEELQNTLARPSGASGEWGEPPKGAVRRK